MAEETLPARWRIIFTDSEGLTGVAPVCPQQNDPKVHTLPDDLFDGEAGVSDVYDCCPEPHIECWTVAAAQKVLEALNGAYAEVCS